MNRQLDSLRACLLGRNLKFILWQTKNIKIYRQNKHSENKMNEITNQQFTRTERKPSFRINFLNSEIHL